MIMTVFQYFVLLLNQPSCLEIVFFRNQKMSLWYLVGLLAEIKQGLFLLRIPHYSMMYRCGLFHIKCYLQNKSVSLSMYFKLDVYNILLNHKR